ncbi:MAG: lipoate--protein ligase family protein, partial [Candidatus Bathyarchaeia archaeon]
MAIDEAVMWARSQRLVPNTVRLYTWRPSAVSIGYFQSLEEEVDVEACRRRGVDVVRRITGGGAVFHAQGGELTYSLVLEERDPRLPESFTESFRVLCRGIVLGLSRLGLEAVFQPVNDITVNNRKVSGSAQTRKSGVVLQHGTVLVKTDPETMFMVLKVPREKTLSKAITAAEERVTSLSKEKGRPVDLAEVRQALEEGFQEALKVEFQ